MDDPLAVRVGEGVRYLPEDGQRGRDRQLVLALEASPERFPGDVGHHVVEEPVPLSGIDETEDVRMLEPRHDTDLAQKAIRPHRRGQLRAHHLDRDLSVVPEVSREEDTPMPPLHLVLDRIPVAERRREPAYDVVQSKSPELECAKKLCHTVRSVVERAEGSHRLQARHD